MATLPIIRGMNPRLQHLQPYPFERLKALFASVKPNPGKPHISLGIGEPQHATPPFIKETLTANLAKLASYPATAGMESLREAIGNWLTRRYALTQLDWRAHVLPVNGSREALFAFAQTVIDSSRPDPVVVCPNPLYQIYEGATLLGGATPAFANADPAHNFAPNFSQIDRATWQRTQLLFVCSPGNPTGALLSLENWRALFALSDEHGFVIASDECYSEIYFNEGEPPLGALQAAELLGRDYSRLIVFSSLSKRSNVPGLRSGFVAGDATLIKAFLLYRTYQGGAMSPPTQVASAAAWGDEAHVIENRALYARKFALVTPMLGKVLQVALPDAGFYLWAKVDKVTRQGKPLDDVTFAKALFEEAHVTVLPGSYLGRAAHGINPGANYVRMALVAGVDECVEAAQRIADFCAG